MGREWPVPEFDPGEEVRICIWKGKLTTVRVVALVTSESADEPTYKVRLLQNGVEILKSESDLIRLEEKALDKEERRRGGRRG